MPTVPVKQGTGQSTFATINRIPDMCPICNRHISPIQVATNLKDNGNCLEVVYICVNSECKSHFISYFNHTNKGYNYSHSLPKTITEIKFSEEITKTSANFIEIFNQAIAAEQQNLHHIAGVGLRKSLEFLIKDYLISKSPNEEDSIKKELLGNSIRNRITDQNIKSCAERAAWLGNDETHYTKKWENKDIDDLKILLQLTVKWIEAELLTKSYLEGMSN
ncbi:DUF4145 domain-containing protein [Leptospira meyeri]|uniref:DUF4145 domain-containing protein n=1 Tax=Leptospira meyeri TaxID=29508 RepID=UPI0002BF1D7C|nr:DUF4145 domain-containing protein [Leptospira meyeri]EMJ85530.1 PF13643 domain protein [Leptospira meyeri serovar Semaranga str. Veldrot Semarang 173]EMJ86388.1 PF13643 domain protein [Leptospira meyeri serovar Semaranga str. Veldrot Semarang 173]EMJ87229.1 PF13643 domain protein [Leptospira meyeri serovar Semaranga str. Veldrot Semarang 173]